MFANWPRRAETPMRLPLKLCSAIFLTWTLAACGSLPSQTFDHSVRASIKRIQVVPIGTPEHAQARIKNPIGAGYGLVGNFVESQRAAGASQNKENVLTKTQKNNRTSLYNSIAQAVSKVGFTIN